MKQKSAGACPLTVIGILVGVGAALLTTRAQLNYSSASVHSMQRAFDEVTERAMVTKIIFSRSGHGPQTVLLWKQESTRQRGLHDSPA
jgi:hypothetical protein